MASGFRCGGPRRALCHLCRTAGRRARLPLKPEVAHASLPELHLALFGAPRSTFRPQHAQCGAWATALYCIIGHNTTAAIKTQPIVPSPRPHRFEAGYARIISGEDEGVYGWIAVNYLEGHLAPAAALPAPVVIQARCPQMRTLGHNRYTGGPPWLVSADNQVFLLCRV